MKAVVALIYLALIFVQISPVKAEDSFVVEEINAEGEEGDLLRQLSAL